MNKLNMLKIFFFSILVLSLSFIFLDMQAVAQEKPGAKAESAEKVMDPMMQKWMEYATPNENHKALEVLVGKWDHVVQWKKSPDAKVEESNGTSETSMIMGGRFLQHKVQGISMGKPFEGMGFIGYDNAKKHYNSIWFDNMGTGMMKAFGKYYPSTKKFVEHGKFVDPVMGTRAFRGVTEIINNDKHIYEIYVTGPDGKEFRMMKIVYNRKK